MLGLENLDGWKLLVLALIGIFIVGPDRLPKAIAEGVRMLRNLRNMARNATGDLSRELGTEISLDPAEHVSEVEAAWEAEIARRVGRIEQGTAKGRPAEDVFHHRPLGQNRHHQEEHGRPL